MWAAMQAHRICPNQPTIPVRSLWRLQHELKHRYKHRHRYPHPLWHRHRCGPISLRSIVRRSSSGTA